MTSLRVPPRSACVVSAALTYISASVGKQKSCRNARPCQRSLVGPTTRDLKGLKIRALPGRSGSCSGDAIKLSTAITVCTHIYLHREEQPGIARRQQVHYYDLPSPNLLEITDERSTTSRILNCPDVNFKPRVRNPDSLSSGCSSPPHPHLIHEPSWLQISTYNRQNGAQLHL